MWTLHVWGTEEGITHAARQWNAFIRKIETRNLIRKKTWYGDGWGGRYTGDSVHIQQSTCDSPHPHRSDNINVESEAAPSPLNEVVWGGESGR